MQECLRHTDDFLQADTQGSRTPRLAAVAEDQQTAILECMKALQQSVLQQGQALQQLQQQQQALQMQSFAQLTPYMQPAAAAAPVTAPAFGDKKTKRGCFLCGGPHMKRDCPRLRQQAPSAAPGGGAAAPAPGAAAAPAPVSAPGATWVQTRQCSRRKTTRVQPSKCPYSAWTPQTKGIL